MTASLSEFQRKKDFLICVDSDGCAMDTMDIKHIRCFGPCLIEEWGLETWNDAILTRWNEINLYTMTRGINRFAGLAKALEEINENYCTIEGIKEFVIWTKNASALSNDSLEEACKTTSNPCFSKALSWSHKVNSAIQNLPECDIKPFELVKEGLEAIHYIADVAVVSSANREAVSTEWNRFDLLNNVDVLCCQNDGTKSHIIASLKEKGYAPQHILMIGDAPSDQTAATENDVFYYPILIRYETESWAELIRTALDKLVTKNYPAYGEEMKQRFFKNLGQN